MQKSVIPSRYEERHDLSEGKIAEIVLTVNNIAIETGEFALSTLATGEVQAYTQSLIGSHRDVTQSLAELIGRLEIMPQDNPASKELKTGGEKDCINLKSVNKDELDNAYIDQVVILYQNVLDMMDNQLMPRFRTDSSRRWLFSSFSPFSDLLTIPIRFRLP